MRKWFSSKLECGCFQPLLRFRWRRKPYVCNHQRLWVARSQMGPAGATFIWWEEARAKRFGERVMDGGEMGTIVRCEMCGGSGELHAPDKIPDPVEPQDA